MQETEKEFLCLEELGTFNRELIEYPINNIQIVITSDI